MLLWFTKRSHNFPLYEMAWWRHQMETFSAKLALCAGNSPVPVNSPHKSQWRGALMFSLIYVLINGWVNNREAGDLIRHRGHYDVIVMGSNKTENGILNYNYKSCLAGHHICQQRKAYMRFLDSIWSFCQFYFVKLSLSRLISSTQVSDSHLSPPGVLQSRRASLQWT